MTDKPLEQPDAPAQDEGDEHPDDLVGEPVQPDHDLNVDDFDEEPDEDGDAS